MNEFLFLLVIMFLPITISVFLVVLMVGEGDSFKRKVSSVFKFDVHKGLISQGVFWLSILVPVGLSLSLGACIWKDYVLDVTEAGFKKFIEISLLPLGVMSISLPLASIVARFHDTHQTAKQIEVVSYKNNLDAFYSHRKELIAYFDAMQEVIYFDKYKFEYYLHPVLHLRFFTGDPSKGFPIVNLRSFEIVSNLILSASSFLNNVLNGKKSGIGLLDMYFSACGDIYHVANYLHVREVANEMVSQGVMARSSRIEGEGYDLLTIGVTTEDVLVSIRFLKGFYDNLCDFSGVPRMQVPAVYRQIFSGGQSLLGGERVIERLHLNEIALLVKSGVARYDEKHPLAAV